MRQEYGLKVIEKKKEALDAVTLRLEIPVELQEKFSFLAGQFVGVTADINGESVHRSYSISSSPLNKDHLNISIKKITNGKMSTYLVDEIEEGTLLKITPPAGDFYKEPAGKKHHIMFAAGSGVTPMISIIQYLKEKRPDEQMSLFYWNQTLESSMFLSDIELWSSDSRVKLNSFLSFTKGKADHELKCFSERANASNLKECFYKWSVTLDMPVFYLCGPEEFMNSVEEFLGLRGYDSMQIRKESFLSSAKPSVIAMEESAETVRYVGDEGQKTQDLSGAVCEAVLDDEIISVEPESDETILEAFLRGGESPPYSCMEGTCMACQCKVLEGVVEIHKDTYLSDEEIEDGLVLSCQAKIKSKKVKVDFDDV